MLSKTDRRTQRVVLALVAVALVTRVVGLNSGLWVDEVYSLIRSVRLPVGAILTEYWGDNHQPLYALLAHASRAVFGEAPWSLRLPAVLFGVASVPLLFVLGQRVAPRWQALLAAWLLTVSYHHVWFSQNARGYSALAFFTLATLWALLRGVESGRLVFFVAYGLLAGLGAYTHLSMIFVVVGHAVALTLWLIFSAPPQDRVTLGKRGTLAFGLGAAVTLALYAPMLSSVIEYFANIESGLKGVSTPIWAVREAVRGLLLALGAGGAALAALVLIAGAIVAMSGFYTMFREQRLFALAVAAPVLVTIAGAAAARGTMYPRFFFFAIGPALLVVVRGVFVTCGWIAGTLGRGAFGDRLATVGVSLAIGLSTLSLAANYRYPKQDFEGAMRFVLANRQEGDQVVTSGIPSNPLNTLYLQPWPTVSTQSALDSLRSATRRTWVIWTFPRILERSAPEIARVLARECPTPRAFHGTVGGGDIMVCALNPQ